MLCSSVMLYNLKTDMREQENYRTDTIDLFVKAAQVFYLSEKTYNNSSRSPDSQYDL